MDELKKAREEYELAVKLYVSAQKRAQDCYGEMLVTREKMSEVARNILSTRNRAEVQAIMEPIEQDERSSRVGG